MSGASSALYRPYGAFELKARYQKYLALSTTLVAGLVTLTVLAAWLFSAFGDVSEVIPADAKVITSIEIPNPPSIERHRVRVDNPKPEPVRHGTIPVPVDDEIILDENAVVYSRDELTAINPDDLLPGGGDLPVVIDDAFEDAIPGPDSFIIVESLPEFVTQTQPAYPALARQAGLEGTVVIKALVGKDGKVRNALVGKSSGVPALDHAALAAAYQNTYRPAIQNGRPANCWVTYKVVFKLNK